MKSKKVTQTEKAERVRKVHPYHDETAEWLRKDDAALKMLRELQDDNNAEVRKLRVFYAQAWLDYCIDNAPEAVVNQATLNLKAAKIQLERSE